MLFLSEVKCFDCILVYYFEIKVSFFEKFCSLYWKIGLWLMIIFYVNKWYFGCCNFGDL